MEFDSDSWSPYTAGPGGSVVGRVLRSEPVELRALGRSTSLWVWLPDVDAGQRVPVLYMHDGDNLFDDAASNTGEWQVDEAMSASTTPCAVVGIPNAGDRRMFEYCPWPNQFTDDVVGERYVDELVGTVIPFVEATMPVLRDRANRGIMGSSLGGVISLFAFLEHPEQFGFVGSMSTAAWWTPEIWAYLNRTEVPGGRVYLDVGTNEMPEDPDMSRAYVDAFHRLRRWATAAVSPEDLMTVEEDGAIHLESAWARRLPAALDFLLPSG